MISQWNELEINTRKKKKYLLLPIKNYAQFFIILQKVARRLEKLIKLLSTNYIVCM